MLFISFAQIVKIENELDQLRYAVVGLLPDERALPSNPLQERR